VEARCACAAGWPEEIGYVELALFCLDHAGHQPVSVTIEDPPRLKVTVGFAVEAASIDEFRAQLTEICQTGHGKAPLLGTLRSES